MNVVCLYHGITAQRAIVFSFFHRSISSLRGRNLADPAETGRDNYAKETRQKARRCSLRRFHREDASRLVPRSFVPDMTFAGFVPGIYADHRRQSRERFNVRRIYCTCAFGKFVGDRWIGRCRRSIVKRREELANDDSSNGSHGCGPLLRFNGIFPSREDLGCWRERRKLCTPVISLPRQVNNRANDERVSQEKNGEGRLFQLLGLRIMFAKVFERPL